MHPYLSQQLARSRQDHLLREAEKSRSSKERGATRNATETPSYMRWMRRNVLVEETRSSCETNPW